MQNVPQANDPTPTVFVLPEQARVDLIQMRNHLRLLALLTEVGSQASRHDALMRPDTLGWWFSRLSKDIDEIVDATYWLKEAAEADAAKAPAPRRGPRPPRRVQKAPAANH
jgi:hypothetical protein